MKVPTASKFDKHDRWVLLVLTLAILAGAFFFFWFVRSENLIAYPIGRTEQQLSTENSYDYYAYALEYRERRLSLALTYRTFLSTLGFLVGVVLASYGGLFILRNATMIFSASADVGQAGGPEAAKPAMQDAKASLVTNSPGVVFLLGGIAVIFFTQYLSIPVGAPEVFPNAAVVLCDPKAAERGTCYVGRPLLQGSETDVDLVESARYLRDDFCDLPSKKDTDECIMIKQKLGGKLPGDQK